MDSCLIKYQWRNKESKLLNIQLNILQLTVCKSAVVSSSAGTTTHCVLEQTEDTYVSYYYAKTEIDTLLFRSTAANKTFNRFYFQCFSVKSVRLFRRKCCKHDNEHSVCLSGSSKMCAVALDPGPIWSWFKINSPNSSSDIPYN